MASIIQFEVILLITQSNYLYGLVWRVIIGIHSQYGFLSKGRSPLHPSFFLRLLIAQSLTVLRLSRAKRAPATAPCVALTTTSLW